MSCVANAAVPRSLQPPFATPAWGCRRLAWLSRRSNLSTTTKHAPNSHVIIPIHLKIKSITNNGYVQLARAFAIASYAGLSLRSAFNSALRTATADSAKQSVKSTAQHAKEGASAAAGEVKKGVSSDHNKSMGSAISDAGTEAKRAAEDTGKEVGRGADDAEREDRMKNGSMLDSASAYVEQAGASVSRAFEDATTSAERAGDDAETKADRATS